MIAAIREAVGPEIEILIDAHGRFDVPTAIRLAGRLEPYKIGWFEEPLPPESLKALRQVREGTNVPICVGERLYTRFDFLPILENEPGGLHHAGRDLDWGHFRAQEDLHHGGDLPHPGFTSRRRGTG